jgi:site-specific DNA-methyltransferase (adenine-specific)
MHVFCESVFLFNDSAENTYQKWESPTVIMSDGPYGISGYKGDLQSSSGLADWYEPHIKAWSKQATPLTTLWFWNTELGWANVHPIIEKHGWEFVSCNIWDKGISHVAGNVNTKTIRHLPVVTEVCVQYIKKAEFNINGKSVSMKEWLRSEWIRSGLPLSKTNEACGVKNAATRKYMTTCHLWYMPPTDAFVRLAQFANSYGNCEGRPYFSVDGKNPVTADEWSKLRAKFTCPIGVTNVWRENQLRSSERIKNGSKAVHLNQKPLELVKRTVEMTSDEHDVVWDPFGGLFTTAIASLELNRRCYSAENNTDTYEVGVERVRKHLYNLSQSSFKLAI